MKGWTFALVGACVVALTPIAATAESSFSSGAASAGDTTAAGCPPGVLKKLNARLNSYRKIPKFVAPGPAFDSSKAKGKTVFNIPLFSGDAFNQIVDQATAEAAKVAGLRIVQYNNQGKPSEWVAGMNQAIAQKVDLIILEGSPNPRLLGPQIKRAKAAGIPTISTHLFDTSVVKQQLKKLPYLTAIVPANHYLGSGTLTADYAIVQSKCNVNALILSAADVQPTSPGIDRRFKAELAKWCPETCKATVVSTPFNEWATKAQTLMQTAMTRDRAINYIAPNYDHGAIFARAAILAAGAQDRVKIVAYNGTAAVMQMIADNKSVTVDIGESYDWLGYANIDQALRILSGVKPVLNGHTPLRLWDSKNIHEAGDPVDQLKGYGNPKVFKDGYAKLWGLR
jgi:ribose transport system substrate-binding protein